jgi:glycosyltransferase involved in cell wall biosynthesis
MNLNKKFKLSVAIPCYEMSGKGVEFLEKSLKIIESQNIDFSKIEIVISDHSINDDIKKCCDKYKNINLKYYKNEECRGSMSGNINSCIRQSSGEYIKPLFQDDFLNSSNSLKAILDNLNSPWIAHEYTHLDLSTDSFYNQRTPFYNDRILEGINTIGPPTVTAFLNDNNYFDENLLWFMDIEFYHRMMIKYGHPTILKCNDPIATVTTWSGQTTETSINQALIDKETNYIKLKYNENI